MMGNGYGQSKGIRLLQELNAEGLIVFETDDAVQAAGRVGIGHSYVRELLLQLVRSGWLVRIKRGAYASTGVFPGENQVPPFAIATHLVRPSAIAFWTALNHHGLTEQVPQVVTCCTPKKVVTPSMRQTNDEKRPSRHAWEIGSIRYEYTTIRPEYFFGIEQVWINQDSRVPITDRERTILDLFAHPRMFGGIGEGLEVLTQHIEGTDVEKLVDYALRYGKGSVIKRLGWAMTRAGVPYDLLSRLRAVHTTGFRAVDPTKTRRGALDREWGVQDNLRQESL